MTYIDSPIMVNLMHAMLGSVTPNWRSVFLKNDNGRLMLTVVLESESPEDREEIEDVVFEFGALEPNHEIAVTVLVSGTPVAELAESGQLVFCRKE